MTWPTTRSVVIWDKCCSRYVTASLFVFLTFARILTQSLFDSTQQPFYLRDDESIYKAVKYSNVVINLIGKFNETPSFTFDEVHVDGARSIAKASREAGVNRLIHVSALNANPDPRRFFIRSGASYLRSKYFGEQAVREEFPNAIIFRPSNMYGEGDKFFNYFSHFLRFQFDKMYLWNKGYGIYKQPVFSSDVAKGIVNAVFDNEILGKTVDAVGCRRYELHDLIKYIMRVTGRGEEYEYSIEELRTAFSFLARAWYYGKVSKYPTISMELLELVSFFVFFLFSHRNLPLINLDVFIFVQENTTDEMTPGNLTLEDLGVTLTPFEENAYYELKPLSRIGFYLDQYGEFKEPPFPKSLI
jgi:NADH dehydrogenase (ubiquinone) 1 alpha subcomplex subunit 9